jgi:FMN-dependent NADH-azoreductase
MPFLRVDSSIRHEGSVSRDLTAVAERAWLAAHPGDPVHRRDLANHPIPYQTWQLAARGVLVDEEQRTAAMREALAVAADLASELLAADAVAIGAPMYNFGVPVVLKTWLDLLMTDPRFDPRLVGVGRALAGVPVHLLVACGGAYGPGEPRAGWDHASPYLRRVFADVLGADVTFKIKERSYTPVRATI